MTSHILPELSRICNKVGIVAGGKLRAFGTLAEVTRELSQKQTIEIQLLSSEQLQSTATKATQFLGADSEISVSEQESIVRCRTAASEEKLAQLLQKLISEGHRISQFREVAGDLEEAFVSAARVADAERAAAAAKTQEVAK